MEQVDIWTLIVQAAIILASLFGGGRATVELVKRLKSWLGTNGVWTQVVAAVVSIILALASLIAEGQLSPDTVRLDNLSVWALMIFAASQAIYRRLVDEGVIHQGEIEWTE